jgi:dehydrogenase/reductase SDR family protein 12
VIDFASAVDAALEFPVAPSFTRIGFETRRRLFHWRELDEYALDGRVVLVTGATSGIGLAAARQLAADGARVVVLGRNPSKTANVVAELRDATPRSDISSTIVDMSDLESVRVAAAEILADHERVDVLMHNAASLTHHRTETAAGTETTVAGQVVGPFLLTCLLLDRLRASAPSRVITMASGGMYTADLGAPSPEMDAVTYNGTRQYARAKRAQVTLNEMWAARFPDRSVVFHSVHPGWADTPGVAEALPTFRRVVGPLLRDPAAGADTLVWLAADDGEPLSTSGKFWLDRRVRPVHRLRSTARSDTPERRRQLWDWVQTKAGCVPA